MLRSRIMGNTDTTPATNHREPYLLNHDQQAKSEEPEVASFYCHRLHQHLRLLRLDYRTNAVGHTLSDHA